MSALSFHLDRLLHKLASMRLELPSQGVLIIEISQIRRVYADGTYHVRRDELRRPLDYETRFDELLQTGYTWLNMSCYGVHDGSLIVAIEVPGPRTLFPGCATSVNLSGPAHEGNVSAVLKIE